MNLYQLDATNLFHIAVVASIWNDACGNDLAITLRFVKYNTRVPTGVIQFGQIAMQGNRYVGIVLASGLPNNPVVSPAQLGWIDAIAVLPAAQKHGIGNALLSAAEEWLRAQGCMRFRLGGGLKPFTPGLPVELNSADFFRKRGYRGDKTDWDVASDLKDYVRKSYAVSTTIRPAQSGDEPAMLEFLNREFPGRWRFEFEEFLRERGRMSDYQLLITERGVDGFARLTFEDSERPIERFYTHRLPKPWGQLGPIGVSKDSRGKGFGGALLDAALNHLREQSIRGCVIDWTGLVDFYGKFGFKPYRQYAMLNKG